MLFFPIEQTMYWPCACIYMFVFIPNGNLWEKAGSFTFDTHLILNIVGKLLFGHQTAGYEVPYLVGHWG